MKFVHRDREVVYRFATDVASVSLNILGGRKKMKRTLSLIVSILLILGMFGSMGIASAEQDVYTITVFNSESGSELNNDPVIQYICDKFGLQFDWISPSWADNNPQMRMLIAGGETPDMMSSQITPGSADFTSLVEDGIILDLTDYLASGDYPNLAAYVESDDTFYQFKYEDRWYGIPRLFDGVVPHNIQFRQDWLDELGLEVPTNFDELYEVLKAVVAADPDGTGTTGLSVQGAWWLTHFMVNFTGCSDSWTKVDDRYVMYYTLDSYKEFLGYMAKLYAEGLLDPDFILDTEGVAQEKFIAGRAFMMNYNIDPAIFAITSDGLLANYPDAVIGVMEPIEGPGGRFVKANVNNTLGINLISSECECPERILAMWDYMASEEGKMLLHNGIEGLHYTVNADGTLTRNEEQFAADTANFAGAWADGYHFAARLLDYSYSFVVPQNNPNYELLQAAADMRHSFENVKPLYTYQFTSDNYVDYNSDVDTVVSEYQIAFITGEKSLESDWDEYLTALDEAGYYSIEDDLNAWMANYE